MIYHSSDSNGGYHRETHNTLDDLPQEVAKATATLAKHADGFDCIIVRGLSGVTLGVPVSLALGKPIVILRSHSSDVAHSTGPVGAKHLRPAARFLFLDDFICAGQTVKACREAVEAKHAEIVATYQSKYDAYTPGWTT